jgi:hypothetical protein
VIVTAAAGAGATLLGVAALFGIATLLRIAAAGAARRSIVIVATAAAAGRTLLGRPLLGIAALLAAAQVGCNVALEQAAETIAKAVIIDRRRSAGLGQFDSVCGSRNATDGHRQCSAKK